MKSPVFVGSGVALVTPFQDGFINFEKYAELIDWHIKQGSDAIIVCGTTGEASTLSIPEHVEAIEFAVKHAAGRIPVIAGSGSNETYHAELLSQAAEDLGADGLMMVSPYYNKTSQHGLVKHFEYLASKVKLPIILYNVPGRTGMSFSLAAYRALADIPNINGVKEASGDFTLIAQIRAACGDKLNLYSGNDDQTLPILALGGIGVISTTANVAPRVMSDICKLYRDGNHSESVALALAHQRLFDAMFMNVNPIPVKCALNLMGKNVGKLRMPLCELCDTDMATLRNVLADYNLV